MSQLLVSTNNSLAIVVRCAVRVFDCFDCFDCFDANAFFIVITFISIVFSYSL